MKLPLAILCLTVAAQEPVDLGVITEKDGIVINRCHTNDTALIEVVHLTSKTNHVHGWFETDLTTLYLSDLSMIPTGTNIFRVRTVCSGSTSEVSQVKFTIRRAIPKPTFDKVDRFPMAPPLPPGYTGPLPGGTNSDYSQVRWYRADRRRNE